MKNKIAEAPEHKEEWIKTTQESVKETYQLSDNLKQTRDSKLRMGLEREHSRLFPPTNPPPLHTKETNQTKTWKQSKQ